jgi:hypothetical protein
MDTTPVPRSVHESDMARMDKAHRRSTTIIIILIILLAATNFYWKWRDDQYVDVVTTQTVTQEADNGINRFVGGDMYGSPPNEDWELFVEDDAQDDDVQSNADSYDSNEDQGP